LRTILIWLLLVFAPFTGVRLVCIDHPPMPAGPAADPDADCEQFCLRSKSPEREVRSADVECILVAQCSLLTGVSTVAVMPGQTPIGFERALQRCTTEISDRYLAPILTRSTPPPKA
jgi:hypothetical protein